MMKRMHPAYVLTQLPRFFWLLVLPLMRRLIEWKNIGLAGKLPLLIAVFLIFAAAFLRWQTQRWAIRGNALLLSNGLFFRRQFRIPFPLIAAVRESRGPLLRLFGAQRIQIETAASRKAAQSMTLYLGKHEAEALLTAYAGEGSFQPVSRMRVRDTLLAALSTSNFALGLFAAAPVLRGAGNLFGTLVQERLWGVLTSAQRLAAAYVPPMLTAIALLALLGWALHVLKLLEQYHRFTLLQNSTSLATRSGLIVKRRLLMRHARLSAFTIRQTPPLLFIRRVQVGVLYAGRTGGRGEKTLLMPVYPSGRAKNLIRSLQSSCPEITVHIPPKEGWRAYLPAFAQVCVLTGVGVFVIFFTSAPLRTVFWAGAVLLPILILFYFPARRREIREGISSGLQAVRTVKGFSEWSVFFLPGARRGVLARQSPGQAKRQICTARVCFCTTRGERFSLHHLPLDSYKNELDEHHVKDRAGPDA